MTTDYISHDETMIQDFIDHPDYADELLAAVIQDGNEYEIQRIQYWYNEAKKQTQDTSYWLEVVEKARIAAQTGHNLRLIYSLLADATSTVKAAMA